MNGPYVIAPPLPHVSVIESLLGETHVTAPPVWLVIDVPTDALVSAHLTQHAARVWVACSDVREPDRDVILVRPNDVPDPDRECLCPAIHDRSDDGPDYCRNACRHGQAVCDDCRDCDCP